MPTCASLLVITLLDSSPDASFCCCQSSLFRLRKLVHTLTLVLNNTGPHRHQTSTILALKNFYSQIEPGPAKIQRFHVRIHPATATGRRFYRIGYIAAPVLRLAQRFHDLLGRRGCSSALSSKCVHDCDDEANSIVVTPGLLGEVEPQIRAKQEVLCNRACVEPKIAASQRSD